MHLEDSDGNNADDDFINSFISSSINLNSGSHIDEIPTRDLGPERPGHHYSQVSVTSFLPQIEEKGMFFLPIFSSSGET